MPPTFFPGFWDILKQQAANGIQPLTIAGAQAIHEGVEAACDFGLHSFQQANAFERNRSYRLALVKIAANALYQSSFLQPINKAGDIGCAVNHPTGDLATCMTLGIHSAQNAQDVVLRPGNAVAVAHVVHQTVQRTRCNQEAKHRLLGGVLEARLLQALAKSIDHSSFISASPQVVTSGDCRLTLPE